MEAQQSQQPLIYRLNRACKELGVCRSTLYTWAKHGRIRIVKIGAGSRGASGVTADSINALLKQDRKEAA